MRKRELMSAALICLLTWFVRAPDASAQPAQVSDALADLKRAVDDLREQTVQIPTLSEAVQALAERVAALQREVDKSARAQASMTDVHDQLDTLRDSVAELRRELANVRTDVANTRQLAVAEPSAWSSGGAGSAGGGVTYDDRFKWATGDGRFGIALAGFMHAAYELHLDAAEDGDAQVSGSSLLMRRTRLMFDGHVGSPRMTYFVALSPIRDVALFDAHLDYAWRPWLRVRVGQYKTLFTRHYIASSMFRAFLDEPLAVDALQYKRDIQAGLYGEVLGGRVSYYAGVGNGAGRTTRNDNIEVNAIVRADVVVLGERLIYGEGDVARTKKPTLMFGVGAIHDLVAMPDQVGALSVNNDVDGNGDIDNVRVISASFDAAFRYRGLALTVEAILRNETYGTILQHSDNVALSAALGQRDNHFYGNFYGQLSYVLPVAIRSHRLLVGGRVGSARIPFLGVGGRASALPRGERALEVDGLIQLYSPRGYRLLGLQYGMRDFSPIVDVPETGGRTHRVILETQLKF